MRLLAVVKQLAIGIFMIMSCYVNAQTTSSGDSAFKPNGKFWGSVFGDYYYKAHADSLNRGITNQYTGIESGRNAFQIRRGYLGYNYELTKKFAAEILLAAEENVTTSTGATLGDLLSNNKLAFYIKRLNLRWKNIWNGTDMIIGLQASPAYSLVEESIWGYRFIEKTITDIRRTASYDLGVGLQGKFDPEDGNFGYNILIANGTSARPENDKFKWFCGDLFAKFFDKKLTITLYGDYQRMNWSSQFHHSRNMFKVFASYSIPTITVGSEFFVNKGKQDVVGINGAIKDTLDATALGLSIFLRGMIVKDKLSYFARFDNYNPNKEYDDIKYTTYKGFTPAYEPNNKEQFITAGLDFTPIKDVHISPNVWFNNYKAQQSTLTGVAAKDHDLVYRATFYYIFGNR